MKIAIHGKIITSGSIPVVRNILDELFKRNGEISISESFYKIALAAGIAVDKYSIYKRGTDFSQFDVMISLGGDGTLLESITYIGRAETPILGINTGRLGFLATTSVIQISQAMDDLFEHKYEIDSRMLIRVESDIPLFNGLNFGLNEFTILKQDTSSMIRVHTWLNGEILNSYWADGLIISTPTGSTGYSLSCGGPVVMPHSHNFIITPVSPHNLNVRPLVVSDDSTFALKVESRSNYYLLSIDSRSQTVDTSVEIKIRKEQFKAKLIKFDGYSFVNTLRKKLHWGFDARN